MAKDTIEIWKALQTWLKVWGHCHPRPIVMYLGRGSFINTPDRFFSFHLGTDVDGAELWFVARCPHGSAPMRSESYVVKSTAVIKDDKRLYGGIDNAELVWKAFEELSPETMPEGVNPREALNRLWLELQSALREAQQQYVASLTTVGLIDVGGQAEIQAYPDRSRSPSEKGNEAAHLALKELEYKRDVYERTVRMSTTLQQLAADIGIVLSGS